MKSLLMPSLALRCVAGLALALGLALPLAVHAEDPPPASAPTGEPAATATPSATSPTATSSTATSPTATPSGLALDRIALGQPVAVNYASAVAACKAKGKRLATRAEVCPSGAGKDPVGGPVAGDIWLAVGDHDNAWVSIGTAYPDRMCKLHEEVTGSAPDWGTDRGPEPVTGQPTALMCK